MITLMIITDYDFANSPYFKLPKIEPDRFARSREGRKRPHALRFARILRYLLAHRDLTTHRLNRMRGGPAALREEERNGAAPPLERDVMPLRIGVAGAQYQLTDRVAKILRGAMIMPEDRIEQYIELLQLTTNEAHRFRVEAALSRSDGILMQLAIDTEQIPDDPEVGWQHPPVGDTSPTSDTFTP